MARFVRSILILLAIIAVGPSVMAAPGGKRAQAQRVATPVPPLPERNPQRNAQADERDVVVATEGESHADPDTAKTADGPMKIGAPVETPAPVEAVEKPLTPEQRLAQDLKAAIAPVLGATLKADDNQKLRDAVRAVAAGDIARARTLTEQLGDPAARKLVVWFGMRNGFGEPADFAQFSDANPAWPDRQLFRRRAEEQLFVRGGSSRKIRAFFGDTEPQTGAGYAALASAYLFEGDEVRAKALAVKVWTEYELATTLETGFLDRFKPLLTEADHKRRFDRILVDNIQFASQRPERAAIAKRVMPLLAADERQKADARLALFLRGKTGAQLLAALPADAGGEATDWGLAYQRVQHLRDTGKMDEVQKILTGAPSDAEKMVSPDDWWIERRAAAYAALRDGKYDVAYAIVRNHGPLSVNPLKDATFMAGWIALRRLDDAKSALPHFQASRAAADGPLTQARADYWLGRTYEALDQQAEARTHYAAAAELFDTFHGQLARQKIGAPDLAASLPPMATAEEIARFNELDAVKAAVLASKADLTDSIPRALLSHLRYYLKSTGEMALLAQLAEEFGDTQLSLRIGKTAIARGMNLVKFAYPVHPFPDYKPLRDPPEKAMLLGIARQESEFNPAIISTAGARGLLQVMPITARHICTDHKVKCDIPRLLKDTSYNAMIASAYIGDRMAEFRGSYVLTLAGYNAGPGRARQWVRAFGDPRDPKIDPIDWIESIPIEETREYVKKVLANIQVYRARLGDPKPLRLSEDLSLHKARGN
jgi:soluble lytic murein transglycosylase